MDALICRSFIDDILMVSKTTRGSTTVSSLRTRTGVEESVRPAIYVFTVPPCIRLRIF